MKHLSATIKHLTSMAHYRHLAQTNSDVQYHIRKTMTVFDTRSRATTIAYLARAATPASSKYKAKQKKRKLIINYGIKIPQSVLR